MYKNMADGYNNRLTGPVVFGEFIKEAENFPAGNDGPRPSLSTYCLYKEPIL